MKLKRLLQSCLLVLIILLGSVCNSDTIKYSSKITNMAEEMAKINADYVMDTYYSLSDSEMDEFVAYLEEYPENFPPFFYILTADHIYKKDKDKALLWYFIGTIRSYEDVCMCKDITARSQIQVYPMIAAKTTEYLQTKGEAIPDIVQTALDWDKTHKDRFDPTWACYHGMNAFYQKPELVSKWKRPKIKYDVRKSFKKIYVKSNIDFSQYR